MRPSSAVMEIRIARIIALNLAERRAHLGDVGDRREELSTPGKLRRTIVFLETESAPVYAERRIIKIMHEF